jgi:hypothetical protein
MRSVFLFALLALLATAAFANDAAAPAAADATAAPTDAPAEEQSLGSTGLSEGSKEVIAMLLSVRGNGWGITPHSVSDAR